MELTRYPKTNEIGIFVIFTILLISISQDSAFGLVWDENRKLTWNDFQGEKNNFNSRHGAMIFSDLSLEYSWKYSETDDCNYEFDKILVVAVFDKKASYVRPWVLEDGRQSVRILNHEQRHFDIAEIHARIFNQQATTELLGEKFSCTSNTLDSQKSKINALAKKQIHDIFDVINRTLDRKQSNYDGDTEHSEDYEKQTQWNKKIDSQLKTLKEKAQKQKLLNKVQTSKDLKQNHNKTPDFDFSQKNPKLIQINERNTFAHMSSGEIPENIFTRGYPLELFIQSPDSSVAKHTIPVTAQKYYNYPVQFDSQSKIGEYKLVFQYKDQIIHSESIVVDSKDTRNQLVKQNMLTTKAGPVDKAPKLSAFKEKQYNVKLDEPKIVKSDCKSKQGIRVCDRPQYVGVKEGESTIFMMSGHISRYSDSLFKPFLRNFPVETVIKYPNSEIKKITTKVNNDYSYEVPLQFFTHSMNGKYKITMEHKDKLLRSEVISVSLREDCEWFDTKGGCSVKKKSLVETITIAEQDKKITHLISGYVPENMYSHHVYVDFFIQYPDSSIKEYRIPVTSEKYFEYPLEFNQKSQQGEYKITVGSHGQKIDKTILNFVLNN